MVMIVNDDNFEKEVLESTQPVLVDFFASWCGPCKAVAPIFEELSKEVAEVKFVKIDVDASPETASKYDVRSIPTFFLFKNKTVAASKVGMVSKVQLLTLLNDKSKL